MEIRSMIKATAEAISPKVTTLSVTEAQALCDRLYGRSVSKMFVASPEVCIDLCMASRVIRSLMHEIDRIASKHEDDAHLLRALRIDVGEC
jgi:hypothetical protein